MMLQKWVHRRRRNLQWRYMHWRMGRYLSNADALMRNGRADALHFHSGCTFELVEPEPARFLAQEIYVDEVYGYYNRQLPAAPRIVDVGAHVGLATHYLLHHFPHATVHAYEPFPTTYAKLSANMQRCHPTQVTTHNVAWGDADGELQVGVEQAERNSIVADSAEISDGVTIRVRAAQTLLAELPYRQFDLLKIDCEGSEHKIFASLTSSQIRQFRFVMLEYHAIDVAAEDSQRLLLDRFTQAGFQLDKVDENPFAPGFGMMYLHRRAQ